MFVLMRQTGSFHRKGFRLPDFSIFEVRFLRSKILILRIHSNLDSVSPFALDIFNMTVRFTMFGRVCRRWQKTNDFSLVATATVRRSVIFPTVTLGLLPTVSG